MMSMTRQAVMRGLTEWRSPPRYGEALTLQQIICQWTSWDDYPSQSQIAEAENEATNFIEQLADSIIRQMQAE